MANYPGTTFPDGRWLTMTDSDLTDWLSGYLDLPPDWVRETEHGVERWEPYL